MRMYDQDERLTKNLMQHVNYLCSKEANGRLSGSNGIKKVAEYLSFELDKLGCLPSGTKGYFFPVPITVTEFSGPVKLKIGNLNLEYRKDFAEFNASPGGVLAGTLAIVRDGEDIAKESITDKTVLIPEKPEKLDIGETTSAAAALGIKALLIESGEPKWFSKEIWGKAKYAIPVIRINRRNIASLVKVEGSEVDLKLPFKTSYTECQNVLGILPGSNSARNIVLSAHMDHLGDDPNGYRYPGAVDNASGVSIIMEVARMISSRSSPLPFNVLIAFLTGEELGVIGAKELLKNLSYRLDAAINVDMMGIDMDLKAVRLGNKEPGNWLTDLASKVLENYSIEKKWTSGGDDSVAFISKGIPTLGLGEKTIDSKGPSIHNAEDTIKRLNFKSLLKTSKIVYNIIEEIAEQPSVLESRIM